MAKRVRLKPSAYLFLAVVIIVIILFIALISKACGNGGSGASGSKVTDSSSEQSEETTPAPTPTPEPTPTPLDVDLLSGIYSSEAIVIDNETGFTINELNPDNRIYPASMTKMMTALVVLDNVTDLDETVVLPQYIFDQIFGTDASSAGFMNGEEATVRDLLYGCMLPSGAECCLGLADHISGGEEAFVALMNAKAEELGMVNTHFTNCTGLHNDLHFSTVRDMAILMRECLTKPAFRTIITTPSYTVSPTNMHPEGFTFYNTLITGLNSRGYGTSIIQGGKTGYTTNAGQCLASFGIVAGHEYIVVTAGAMGDPYNGDALHIDDAASIYTRLNEYYSI